VLDIRHQVEPYLEVNMNRTELTVKAKVLKALYEHPSARDDNNVLVGLVWQMEDPSLPVDFHEKVQALSKVETIRRECKKIQHVEGRFPPSQKALEARRSRIGAKRRSGG
jgi:hypothetical protein